MLAIIASSSQALKDDNSLADAQEVVRENYTGITASQACEDVFNFQKNHKQVKGKKKYRRPEKCYAVAVGKRVLSEQHRYAEVTADQHGDSRSERLPRTHFYPDAAQQSLPFHKIASYKQSPDFHSPSAEFWCQRDAGRTKRARKTMEKVGPPPSAAWRAAPHLSTFSTPFLLQV